MKKSTLRMATLGLALVMTTNQSFAGTTAQARAVPPQSQAQAAPWTLYSKQVNEISKTRSMIDLLDGAQLTLQILRKKLATDSDEIKGLQDKISFANDQEASNILEQIEQKKMEISYINTQLASLFSKDPANMASEDILMTKHSAKSVLEKEISQNEMELATLKDTGSSAKDINGKEKKIIEMKNRLNSIVTFQDLGVNQENDIATQRKKMESQLNEQMQDLQKTKFQIVSADPRFDQILKIKERKLEVQRQLQGINKLQKLLASHKNQQMHVDNILAVDLTLMAILPGFCFRGDELSRTQGEVSSLALVIVAFVLTPILIYERTKKGTQMNEILKLIEQKQRQLEIENQELGTLFDNYTVILGLQ